jgi:phenylacetate-coenzyme A ligase PaaK-like adenylate-forming protein
MAPAIYDVLGRSVTAPLAELVADLDAFDPDTLMAYPSALSLLATERLAGRLTISPAVIRAMGEPFTDDHRTLVARAFPEAGLVDLFGSSEGLFGLSAPGARPIELAEDLAIVELVDADDRPVPMGTPCARVLLTVLDNPVQPLIRYELTDVMVEHPGPSAYRHVTVEGRNDDPFRYGDLVMHPIVFRGTLNAFATVVEYQVHQTVCGARVDLVTSGPLDEGATVAALCGALGTAGLPGPDVTVRVVADLERNAGTGKFRRFVPLG